MSSRALRNLPAWNNLPGPSRTSKRFLHQSLPRASAATAAAAAPANAFFTPSAHSGMDQGRLSDLMHHLQSGSAVPNRVWASYQALLADASPEQVPLDIHQRVLRKCAPSFADTRHAATRLDRSEDRAAPAAPHMQENRFRAVVNNIRLGGGQVTLDDLHFILRQFAAAGHHFGSRQVLAEMARHGVKPTAKTYSFVFQAMAHRLTLPIPPGQEEIYRKQAAEACYKLLNIMARDRVPLSPACIDLVVRIVRETADADSFDLLLKNAYGIDLLPPTATRLGFASLGEDSTTSSAQPTADTPAPLPFSLSALNTIVDTLGRTGRVSKLVQAFEVLTTPLPPPRAMTEEEVLELDDEDDDPDSDLPWEQPTPYTRPNTTTYNFLIRWVSEAKNSTLARHYVTEAMEAERLADRRLRSDVHNNVPLGDIVGPRIAVNRRTLQPVIGLAHDRRDVILLRWLHRICQRIMRRKTVHIGYYQDWVGRLHEQGLHEPLPALLTDVRGARQFLVEHRRAEDAEATVPSSSARREMPALDIDLDAAPGATSPHRPFKPAVHIAILQRDLAEVAQLSEDLAEIIGRVVQRRKERIGRRVWAGKDVWVRDEGRRVELPKETWAAKVGWQPRGVAGKDAWRDVWSEELMVAERRQRPKATRYPALSRAAAGALPSVTATTPSP
jgi:hypothetical protein